MNIQIFESSGVPMCIYDDDDPMIIILYSNDLHLYIHLYIHVVVNMYTYMVFWGYGLLALYLML